MKIDRISYPKIFPTGMAYLNHKIGVEIQLDAEDDANQAFQLAKEYVDKMNLESNPGYAAAMEYSRPSEIEVPIIQKTPYEQKEIQRIAAIKATIGYCTTATFLEKFQSQVERENNPELTEAYNNKLKELQ